jgi:CHAD domain-containing protein
MMTISNETSPIRAECVFGIQRLLPLLEAFSKEIGGVKNAQDIEHIHRMRVASRRLRAALPLFVSCMPERKYHQWLLEIQKITRALGYARDADVQIAFITKLLKKRGAGTDDKHPDIAHSIRYNSDVETMLLNQLQKKRLKLQAAVVTDLEKLEKSGIIDEMRTFFLTQTSEIRRTRKKSPPFGIPPVAALRISSRLKALLSYERWVHTSDAVAEHHAMRIAAKKLRYTMEVYAPLYRLGLKKYLSRVKKIQEILGDLHDCDVWIDTVMVMLLKERSTYHVKDSTINKQVSRVSGYRHFLTEREKERKRLYLKYVRYWDSLARAGIWDELCRTLNTGRKRKFQLPEVSSEAMIRSSVTTLAGQYPEGIPHTRNVTMLALRMFDDLIELHQMGAWERFLLECACSLHDIGWKYGQKGHAKHSADMILSDEQLLLDINERNIIALVARAHRKNDSSESGGIFSLLTPKERDSALMLASLIRIADALDYSHSGSIQSVHCTINPEAVEIKISAVQDASSELEHARLKGDLFVRVFKRALVIR